MNVIAITCDNCGAKYKLPPTFKGAQAKCQKCGSIIDVAKQRAAAEAGDGAKPAAAAKPASKARPAVDRSKRSAGASSRKAAAGKPARSTRGRGRGAKEDNDEERPRRGRQAKKADNTPLILGGVGLLVILVAGGFFLLSGDDEKKADEQAKSSAAAKADETPAGDNAAAAASDKSSDAASAGDANVDALVNLVKDELAKLGADAGAISDAAIKQKLQEQAQQAGILVATMSETQHPKVAEAVAKALAPSRGDAAADKPAEAVAAPNPDAVPMPEGKSEPWMRQKNPAETMADVRSAAEQFGDVRWPESIDDAAKAEVKGVAEDLDVNGGIRHIRAKRKIVDAGFAGLFAILERLHGLNYGNADDAAFGFELNKMIEEITGGLNAKYSAVQAGEDVHPAKAQWNTKNVGAWMKQFAKWPDEAAFKKFKKEYAKKNAGK